MNNQIATYRPAKRLTKNFGRFTNDLPVLFVGAVLGTLSVNAYVFAAFVGLIALKEMLRGRLFRALNNNALVVLLLLALGLTSFGLLTQASRLSSLRGYLVIFLLVAIGLSIGTRKRGGGYLTEGLVAIRDLVVLSCILSILLEIIGHSYFDVTSNYYQPFQLLPVDDFSTFRLRSVFGHPIVFAHLLLIASLITYFFESNKARKYTLLLVFLVFIYYTRTCGAWLIAAFLFLASIVRALSGHRIRHWDYVAIASPLVLLALWFVFFHLGVWGFILDRFAQFGDDYLTASVSPQYHTLTVS